MLTRRIALWSVAIGFFAVTVFEIGYMALELVSRMW